MADLQAFIERIEFIDDSKARVRVVVTDGTQKAVAEVVTSSLDDLKAQARNVLANIAQAEALKALTAGSALDLTPTPPPDPTPDELALRAFVNAYAAYQSGAKKIQVGLLQADDPDVAALLKAVQSAYQPAFVGMG